MFILDKDEDTSIKKYKIKFLKWDFIYEGLWGEKIDQSCAKKCLNHELSVTNHISWKAEFDFTGHTQAWLLPKSAESQTT